MSLPAAAIFSRTSSSRSRMSVGLSASSLAVLAWLRIAAVSSRRDDQVGLGRLLGLRDLVHQVLHLARQDHVADTDRDDLQTQLAGTPADRLLDLLADRVLVGQERVEFAGADHGPQRQLRLAVQRLPHVVRRADRLAGVDDAVGHDGVQPQRDLVGRHDLLTADVEPSSRAGRLRQRWASAGPFQKAYWPGGSVST